MPGTLRGAWLDCLKSVCGFSKSGWTDVERPEFDQMIEFIKINNDVNVVFFDYSRIYRKAKRAIAFFDKMDSWSVLTVSACNSAIDCRTAAGRAARRAEFNKAEDFSDFHSEQQKSRMKNALFSGRWHSKAPPGFENVRAKRGEPNIIPVEPLISFIRDAFLEFRSRAYTRSELLREMSRRGMRDKNGNEFTLDHFVRILRNPAYNGRIPSEEYGPQPGLHKKIVSDEVFRDVQLILDGRKPVTAPYAKNRLDVPLRSFLRCSVCETPLTGGPSTGNHGKTRYNYYRCYRCKIVNVRAEQVGAQFVGLLRQLPSGEVLSSEYQEILKDEWEKKVGDEPNIEERLSRKLNQSREKMKNLVRKYVNDDPAVKPYFDELKLEYEAEIADIQAEISKTEESKASFTDVMDFSRSISVNLASAWEVSGIDQKQRIQNTLFPDV
jgi:DNA invertase Pin-like site-specific DNA recombinase